MFHYFLQEFLVGKGKADQRLNDREFYELFKYCDLDGSGNLDIGEFMFNLVVCIQINYLLPPPKFPFLFLLKTLRWSQGDLMDIFLKSKLRLLT